MPSFSSVRITRMAISPRFATRTFPNMRREGYVKALLLGAEADPVQSKRLDARVEPHRAARVHRHGADRRIATGAEDGESEPARRPVAGGQCEHRRRDAG